MNVSLLPLLMLQPKYGMSSWKKQHTTWNNFPIGCTVFSLLAFQAIFRSLGSCPICFLSLHDQDIQLNLSVLPTQQRESSVHTGITVYVSNTDVLSISPFLTLCEVQNLNWEAQVLGIYL